MPAPASPEAGRTPAQAGRDMFEKALPTPSPAYAAGGMGGVASTGAGATKQISLEEAGRQINATRQRYSNGDGAVAPTPKSVMMAPQTRIKDDPTFRMPKTPGKPQTPVDAQPVSKTTGPDLSTMHPSDQAKMLREQLNQKRRDVAFGRGSFAPGEEAKLMAQHEALIAQSNKMRNAPGYMPDAKSTNPRDMADRARLQLNQQRSAAGGEVPQAGKVMNQVNQLSRQWDNMPASKIPGASGINPRPQARPMPAGPAPASPRQTTPPPMFVNKTGAAVSPFEFGLRMKKAFMGPGALVGMATAPKGQEDLSIGRGALRGLGTGMGVGTGAVTGGVGGGLLGGGLGALVAALNVNAKNRFGRSMSLSERAGEGFGAGAPVGALAGILPGAVYGGYKGNMATKALLDKTAPMDEPIDDEEDKKPSKKDSDDDK
jgi:hypothetical protein